MLEGMLSQTDLYNVAIRLGCTHTPTMSIFANIPPNSWSLAGRPALRKRWRSHKSPTPSRMSWCRRLLPWPTVADKSTLTGCCPRSNYQGTTGRTNKDECRWRPCPREYYSAATQYGSVAMEWAQNIPSSLQSMEEGCLGDRKPCQNLSPQLESGGHQTWCPKWQSSQEEGPHTPCNSSERCLSQHETTTPKPPRSHASWWTGESARSPQIPTLSKTRHTTDGS